MNRSTLKYLIVCVAILLIGTVAFGFLTSGLDSDLVARARAEVRNLQQVKATVNQSRDQVQQWVEADPELFQARELGTKWEGQFGAIQAKLKQAEQDAQQLTTLLDQNEAETSDDVLRLTESIAAKRLSAHQASSTIRSSAERLVNFKKQIDEKLPEMEKDVQTIAQFDLSTLQSIVDKAISDWPTKKENLEQRIASLKSLKESAAKIWESTSEARQHYEQKQLEADDVNTLVEAANRIADAKATLLDAPDTLKARVDELYWSWDKILSDMQIVEGRRVQFIQTFKTIKVQALVPEGEQAETVELPTEQRTVSKSQFEAMKKNLGMVVEHKPAGKYDSEAVRVTQPPGFAYVAPPNQQRNRYGYWDRRGGSSFWVFYGQYSLMRDLMGGNRYGPISTTMYEDYRRHRRVGRPYYGRTGQGQQRYGTGGAVTRTRYADSRYVRTDGFKNSKYVRSGGTYRGSAYETRRRSSSRSSRSYSSRSRGFRSGGFGGK